MKSNLMKNGMKALSLSLVILLASCNKDENMEELTVQNLTAAEVNLSDEADLISEDITTIVEDIYTADEAAVTGKGYVSDFLPDCVTVTTVQTSTSIEKTVDFGEGCELRNGNVLSGIIMFSYDKDMEAASKTFNVSFENFTFNEVAIEGSKQIVRLRANENNNPESTRTVNLTATWPDGSFGTISGNRTREWIEGHGTGTWVDNVFLISGNWGFTNREGVTYSKEVLTSLRREWACRFIVSGELLISKNDASVTLDFGDGSCDGLGELTFADGSTKEIVLRRFR
jgi:hypothetical protein